MEITFKDITRIIKKKYCVYCGAVAFMCGCVIFCNNIFVQKTYTSTVKLYVETNYKKPVGL